MPIHANVTSSVEAGLMHSLVSAAAHAGHINYTPARNGKSMAVCHCCGKRSSPAPVDKDGEPDLWEMARGWSQAPYPHKFQHKDGSFGSLYTCPSCNKRLASGETLQVRSANHTAAA